MKIVQGSSRIVLMFDHFVLKFPRINSLISIVINVPKLCLQGRGKLIPTFVAWKWEWFLRGVRQNITERICWKTCQASFLVPTYLSLGFMNVQKREYGEGVDWQQGDDLAHAMGTVSQNQVYTIDPHCLSPKNLLRNDSGYRLLDYGDSSYQPLRFTDYILRWHKELAKVMCADSDHQ